jgi:hypothetical protein
MSGEVDIVSEMKKALSEGEPQEGAPSEVPESPKVVAKASEDAPEAPQEALEGQEQPEGEAPPDEEAAKTEEVKVEEEKKNSSYQRLSKKYEKASAEAKAKAAEAAEALVIANEWRQRAFVLAKELKKVVVDARKTGYTRDHRDDKILTGELQKVSKDLREESRAAHERQEHKMAVEAAADDLAHEADVLSRRYPGLTRDEILLGYAVVVESSKGEEDPPMDEIAQMLHTRKNKAVSAREQVQTNRTAPRTIRQVPSFSKPPDFKADRDGMKSFLKSQGLA